MTGGRTASAAATICLATAALLLFGNLTLRHVGESYFLADQVDQLQKFEAALRLEPEGLWGPAMSGTAARALGPFGALIFGLPVSLGLGIDAIHGLTSVMLVIATALAFWQLARLDLVLAWGWLLVFTAMRMVWWNAAMLWVNTLLLPLGLVALALSAASLRRPSVVKVASLVLVMLLALHIHLAALVGLPIILMAALQLRRPARSMTDSPRGSQSEAGSRGLRRWRVNGRVAAASTVMTFAAIALAVAPYVFAEVQTGLRNTRAMFSHIEATGDAGRADSARVATETLILAADPMAFFPDQRTVPLIVGVATVGTAILLLWRRRAGNAGGCAAIISMFWLLATAAIGVTGQALFFWLMARPLNGLHYAMLLAPWYAIPPAALVAALLPDARSPVGKLVSPALGGLAVLLLIVRGPGLADRFAEPTEWNYQAIVGALDTLCSGRAVHTVEGVGLANDLTPSYDSVLRYLLKRGFARCRYDSDSDLVIVAKREAAFEPELDIAGRHFTRERVLPPGLALYRRVN